MYLQQAITWDSLLGAWQNADRLLEVYALGLSNDDIPAQIGKQSQTRLLAWPSTRVAEDMAL